MCLSWLSQCTQTVGFAVDLRASPSQFYAKRPAPASLGWYPVAPAQADAAARALAVAVAQAVALMVAQWALAAATSCPTSSDVPCAGYVGFETAVRVYICVRTHMVTWRGCKPVA